jgi:DNA-binding transcriptional ArsR family regulator
MLELPAMGDRALKDALFEQFARVGKALASARRLELLELLAQAERTVDELARESGLSLANASQHLRILRDAGLVAARRDGVFVHYALAGDDVLELWLALRAVAADRLAEVERAARAYLGGDVEGIGRDELMERARSGDLVVLDVRPAREFAAGHIQGARSIPIEELEDRLDELPPHVEVVAYCRGPYCVYAHEAVRRLEAAGHRARRLEDGWPEWRLEAAGDGRAAGGATPRRASRASQAAPATTSTQKGRPR